MKWNRDGDRTETGSGLDLNLSLKQNRSQTSDRNMIDDVIQPTDYLWRNQSIVQLKTIFDKSHSESSKVVDCGLGHGSERVTRTPGQRETTVGPLQHLDHTTVPVRTPRTQQHNHWTSGFYDCSRSHFFDLHTFFSGVTELKPTRCPVASMMKDTLSTSGSQPRVDPNSAVHLLMSSHTWEKSNQ